MTLNVRRQTKVLLLIGTLVLANFALVGFVIWPTVSSMFELKNQITDTQTHLETNYQQTQRLKRSLHEHDEVYAALTPLNNATVPPNQELALITQLEDMAKQHDISQSMSIAVVERDGSTLYQLTFNLSGRYEDVVDYLHTLEIGDRYMLIDAIEMHRADNAISVRFVGSIPMSKSTL